MATKFFLYVVIITWLTSCQNISDNPITSCIASQKPGIHSPNCQLKLASFSNEVHKDASEPVATSLFYVFDTSQWPARWNCGVWSPAHGWLYIISDIITWLAYFSIPGVLGFYYIKKQREIPFKYVYLLFITFILACGLTHLIDAIIFWWPAYKLSAWLRFFTAIVSSISVVALVKIAPSVMEYKGPNAIKEIFSKKVTQLSMLNDQLQEEVKKRSEAEQRLQQLNDSLRISEEKFTSILEYSAIGMAIVSLEGDFLDVNNSLCNTLGYAQDELKSLNYLDITHKDDLAITREMISKMNNLEIKNYELEKRYYHKNGNLLWGQTNVTAAYDSNGQLQYFIKQIQDVTEKRRQEIEKQKINKQLEQKIISLKTINEELDSFTYSVSHDLRSPLRSINGFGQALKEDYSEKLDELGKSYLKRIIKAAIKMGGLIDDLLNLSRISRKPLKFEPVNLSEICQQIIDEKEGLDKYDFQIDKEMKAHGDLNLLTIAAENLINNAIKYSSKVAHPLIQIGVDQTDKVFYIKDNGVGFDTNHSDKLFGPFQRLHKQEEFEGVGIGLAIVKRIITKHGGSIWAESKVNNGATFYFKLDETAR
ncbi:sensor histidine kinase [Fulvivirga lutea]|uniref:histidine kinase n=1 Tax=Fulvivirga lutea TaxID=2810512 RepID=A0A974WI33_9BACT|nr:PAS domain S-box protein [Fulvivirga lutea]QSE98821.1 PAS domain S-box protein [Fulvivirga lutea]